MLAATLIVLTALELANSARAGTLVAAPLAHADEAGLPDALKEVELLDADVAETVVTRDAPVDGACPVVWNPMKLAPPAPVDADA